MEMTSGISRGMVKQCQCNQHQGKTFLTTISHQLFHWDIFEIQDEWSECNNQVLTLLPLCDVAQEQPVGDLWSSPALLHRPAEHWGRDRAPELEDCKLQEYPCHLRSWRYTSEGFNCHISQTRVFWTKRLAPCHVTRKNPLPQRLVHPETFPILKPREETGCDWVHKVGGQSRPLDFRTRENHNYLDGEIIMIKGFQTKNT